MPTKKKSTIKDAASLKKPRQSSPLRRTFDIMEVLASGTRPMSSAEMALQVGFDPSTTHRLLQSLVSEGYLLRDDSSKRYVASPKLLFPLPLYHPWHVVRRDVAPTLLSLRDDYGFTSGLVIFFQRERVLLDFALGRDPLSPDYHTWLESPLHASGSGRVLLMGTSPAERRQWLGPEPFHQFTEQTITTYSALDAELDTSIARGYATACDDYIDGFRVLAAPLTPMMRPIIGCLFCSGRATTLTDEVLPRLGAALNKAASFFALGCVALQSLAELVSTNGPVATRTR